jgi:hypothetical protein
MPYMFRPCMETIIGLRVKEKIVQYELTSGNNLSIEIPLSITESVQRFYVVCQPPVCT